jgi:multidrug efflux pump subunit AcrB
MKNKLGISGGLAARFQDNALTPLLAIAAMLLGMFAVIVTPREEEPQIDVTFANVFVGFPGASTNEVENLVALPMEQVLAEIDGVKHVYSISRPGMGVLTVQFEVGEPRTEALVRLYNAIFSNQDWRPQNLGILPPIVKPKGIDDVPIVSATLWTQDTERATQDLLKVAHALEAEIKRVPGTRDVYTIGGSREIVHVELDPQRVAGFGMTLDDLRQALTASNTVSHAGALVYDNTQVPVQAGTFLSNREDVARLVVGMFEGRPVYLDDIATVSAQADQPETHTWFATGPAADKKGIDPVSYAPSVTIAIAKKPGTNATHIADAVVERLAQLEATLIPEGVEVTITRNYGKTADDKASKLIQKLSFATMSVILLTWFALGWREAIVVGAAVIVTLAATLFASWAWGFTINRVSLFALIFAIGILVDDAIVVVENIHRHRGLASGSIGEIIPPAVDEVGGPTILATFTVIAALLPMAFVSGLMGPYMSPIPINASTGMLISLAVALILTPWLSHRLLQHAPIHKEPDEAESKLHQAFQRLMHPFLDRESGKRARHGSMAARPRSSASPCCSSWRNSSCSRCCRSTTSRSSRWWSTCPRAPASSRPPGYSTPWPSRSSACPRSPITRFMRARPRPSTSTAWCGSTTSAATATPAISRSTSSTRTTASAPATRLRGASATNWPQSAATSAPPSRSPRCRRARRSCRRSSPRSTDRTTRSRNCSDGAWRKYSATRPTSSISTRPSSPTQHVSSSRSIASAPPCSACRSNASPLSCRWP